MQDWVELLFTRRLWVYDPHADWYAQPYHWINLIEGAAWECIALAVMIRWARHRRSNLEWVYAVLFIAFGLTDFREAMAVHGWLIWLKAAILAGILATRWKLRRDFYPESKTL